MCVLKWKRYACIADSGEGGSVPVGRVSESGYCIRACSLAPSPLKPGGAGPGGRGAVFRGNGYGALADMNWQVQNPAGTLSERLSMFLTTCSPRPRSLSLVIPSASSVSLQIIALPAADAASRVNGPTSQTSRSRRTSSEVTCSYCTATAAVQ